MKKLLLISTYLFVMMSVGAQTLNWAYSFTNPAVLEDVTDISANGTNRFAIIGNGNAGISMDAIGGSAEFLSPGNFLAVYNADAAIQWLKPTVGFAFGVKLSADGSVFVTGRFSGTVDFDPSDGQFLLTSVSGGDAYLQKFDAAGQFQWAMNASIDGAASEIVPLGDGRVVVAGRSDVDAVVTLTGGGTVNLYKGVFLLEFSSSGALTNAFSISVPAPAAYMYVYSLTADSDNNILLGGTLDGVADFDLNAGTVNNPMTNGYDAYIAKYNSSFGLEWVKYFGDTNNPVGWDKLRGISTDNQNNVYAGGEFTWTTDFDPANPGNLVLQSDDNAQTPSGFIIKYNPQGTPQWVKKIGNTNLGSGSDFASVSLVDMHVRESSLYALFEGWGFVDIDPSEQAQLLEVGAVAAPGIIFAEYNLSGQVQAGFDIDGANSLVAAKGLGLLSSNSVVSAGTFQKSVDFDPGTGSRILSTDVNGPFYSFDKDLFIAKYTFAGPSTTIENHAFNYRVFPNPVHDILTIEPTGQQTVKYAKVYDLHGKQILYISGLNAINMQILHNGLYLLEVVSTDNTVYRQTLLKH